MTPVKDTGTTVDAVTVISKNVTEQKTAENRILIQRDLAMAFASATTLKEGLASGMDAAISVSGMDALGTLAGGIAHDFNNLLMAIQGNASLMLLDTDPAHPHYQKLKHIEEYIRTGADLTKQLLGFARGGKYEVRSTDLNELMKRSAHMFGRTKKEIAIHTKFQEGLWPVTVDRGQMEQVLLNLFVNAWQAMPSGGDLYLETQNVTLDNADVRPLEAAPGHYVKLTITDTGVGMDEATRKKIFDP